ncbi:Retrovirus-related Pol polyprotein from transposon TNT 1-94 [Vitis vinifera]|uniref:Retrovirus-related Pol polyprotein from transposon TNT 1-94 n=1 Tax=Vitis vinifera TaxID=29760 RepID=A0A438I8V2_VITVI|nr:Retrovirus-related Pol polyprotein from transposon TNT 1-94 [Vitis vinifera]
MELWFMSQGYEDHFVTQEADIPEAKGLYTNDIQRLYKVASSIVNVKQQDMDLSTYIGQIASRKEEFLTVMPLTTDVGDQRTQIDKFFMVLTLISLRPDLETVRDQILGNSSIPSLDDFLKLTLEEDAMVTEVKANVLICTYCNKLGHTCDRCYQLHGRPPCTAHVDQSSDPQPPQPLSSSTSQGISLTDSEYDDYLRYQATKSASITSVAQTGNVSTCLTHTSSLGPWILDSGASDHISGNKDLFSSITTTSVLPTDRSTGKTIGIGRESQGLYHLTSPSTPAVCISTDAPLLIHSRLGHPSLSKFQKMDKLSTKATKCIFLGYSKLQKGYRCYSSETHRYFFSTDVTFFEDSPFFSTSESLPVSEVLPLPIISPPDAVPSRPLQVYHRHHRVVVPPSLAEVPANSFLSLRLLLPRLCLLLLTYPLLFKKSTPEALSIQAGDRQWVDEMDALHSNGTWDLVVLPSGKFTVSCRWVYTVKVDPDDSFVRLLLSMVVMRSWPLYQLDIKNVFLHGNLAEEIYMEQPPSFVAQGKSGLACRLRRSLYGLKQSPRAWFSHFSSVVQEFGMFRNTVDHSVFYHHNSSGQCIYLIVYVDNIVITSSDQNDIQKLNSSVVLSQRKYALDILEETVNSYSHHVIVILRYIKSTPGQGVLYENRGHTQVVGYTDVDWAGSPTDRRSTFEYCVFIGGNLISWKSKKQNTVVRSSAKAEYRAITLATCKPIWLKHLLGELRFGKDEQMKLICDNQAALHITSNPVFHERTKHIGN